MRAAGQRAAVRKGRVRWCGGVVARRNAEFSVAPMAGHTNVHFRHYWRLFSKHSTLYTEMIPAQRIVEKGYVFGDTRGVVLQLGGSNPSELARAAYVGKEAGFAEVNLNCGCPSAAVASRLGNPQGAALMRHPELVLDCCDAMSAAVGPDLKISVKHRIGTCELEKYHGCEHDSDRAFYETRRFIETVASSGVCSKFIVHSRIALLPFSENHVEEGRVGRRRINERRIDTRANRRVPPLRHDVAQRLIDAFPHLDIVVNGGFGSLRDCLEWSSVMVGRAVINHPCAFADVDRNFYGTADASMVTTRGQILDDYMRYVESVEANSSAWYDPKTLAAVPFHLFNGELNTAAYMRTIRQLARKKLDKNAVSVTSILKAAKSTLSRELLYEKPVTDACSLADFPTYDREAERAGPMHRVVH